jgi:hypothetical protein
MMQRDALSWRGVAGVSLLVGAIVIAGTLVFLADRIGWVLGVVLGLLPALLLGLTAMLGHLVVTLVLSLAPANKALDRLAPAAALVPSRP